MILGPMAGAEPQHANFALRFQRRVSMRLIVPLAIFQGVTGLLLIWKTGINLFATYWLLVGIVLYLIALAPRSALASRPSTELVAADLGAAASGAARRCAAHRSAARSRGTSSAAGGWSGMAQSVLIVIIVFLMVTKPF